MYWLVGLKCKDARVQEPKNWKQRFFDVSSSGDCRVGSGDHTLGRAGDYIGIVIVIVIVILIAIAIS